MNIHEENQLNAQQNAEYEAPQIESVLTPDELEREVAYAGNIIISGGVGRN